LTYRIIENGQVSLIVYDINGRQVDYLAKGLHSAGIYSVEFNAEGLSSGVYFAVLNMEGNIQTQKLLLMK